jgi:hypothetical protein
MPSARLEKMPMESEPTQLEFNIGDDGRIGLSRNEAESFDRDTASALYDEIKHVLRDIKAVGLTRQVDPQFWAIITALETELGDKLEDIEPTRLWGRSIPLSNVLESRGYREGVPESDMSAAYELARILSPFLLLFPVVRELEARARAFLSRPNDMASIEMRAIHAALAEKTPREATPEEIRAVLACLKRSPSMLEKSTKSVVESNDLRSFWRYFLIGFAGPAALTQSIVDLKPLEPGESLRLAWSSTLNRLANAAKRI